MFEDPAFWVAFSLFLFLALIVWKKVPGLIGGALDKQIAGIRSQIEQARQLRAEAQALLARFEQDQKEAASTARELVATAEREAKLITDEAARALDELIARRTAIAADKIAQAEAAAIKEVRKVAVESATVAAARLIADNLGDKDRDVLVTTAIDDLGKHLH